MSHPDPNGVPPPTHPDPGAVPTVDRVTAGKRFLLRGDGRSREARRLMAIYRDVAARTPLDPESPIVRTRLRAFASVALALEELQAKQAAGGPVDAGELVALTNTHGRLLRELGFIVKKRKGQ